ncbi:MAG TPA: hypothetical protein VFW09_18030, partial [Solirubrobacteraceae bacterium]|nr:hypothetical protein [Solirubrobacteraceae bacterium]
MGRIRAPARARDRACDGAPARARGAGEHDRAGPGSDGSPSTQMVRSEWRGGSLTPCTRFHA